jgi:hypothetical protein
MRHGGAPPQKYISKRLLNWFTQEILVDPWNGCKHNDSYRNSSTQCSPGPYGFVKGERTGYKINQNILLKLIKWEYNKTLTFSLSEVSLPTGSLLCRDD